MSFDFTFPTSEDSGRPDFEILEPGWYDFTVNQCFDSWRDGTPLVSKHGTEYLKILCEEHESGKTLMHVLFLDAEKPFRVVPFLTATGYHYAGGDAVSISAGMFTGKQFRGQVEVANGMHRIVRTEPIQSMQVKEAFAPLPAEATTPTDPELEEDVPF